MTYPVRLYCRCGAKVEDKRPTQDSANQYSSLWKQAHIGPSHELLNEVQYRRVMKERAVTHGTAN